MLTATYSLVTLLVEQKTARRSLAVLQQQLQSCASSLQASDMQGIQKFLKQFLEFDAFFRERNIELYVLPAIRRKTGEADNLITELEELKASAIQTMKMAVDRIERTGDVITLVEDLDRYCLTALQRLMKEDELLPLSQRIISNEVWFEMAALFISKGNKQLQTFVGQPVLMH